ncbi:BOP1NT-domain-containing protein [Calocera viscosa TUFC12733]|uniref:Ribosome biogenesis protein ERB1 n=1 Tax=Calocera viscosa (strain TUFC12733) TaxID=1330018 RepID=A0A167FV65_CALVF|nr:BOP1NT-domain-containing protein [Calocera viscosa TUFC12733]
MATAVARAPAVNGTKRKVDDLNEKSDGTALGPINLTLSDPEESEGTDGSDGEEEPFPELDLGSDTEEDEDEEDEDDSEYDVEGSEDDEDNEEDDEDEDEEQTPDSRLTRLIAKYTEKPDESDPSELRLEDPRAPKIVQSNITGFPKKVYPEIDPVYDSDSSTEEDPNRIGNVPLHWYDDLPHIGYDIDGKRVMRPAKGDELDKFLSTVEDPTSWSTAVDKSTGAQVQLSAEELELIGRLARAENPDGDYDPYEPMVEWFTGPGKEMTMPLTSRPEPKSRFIPSKWEHKKVMKIVRAIRQGRITPHGKMTAQQQPQFYALWSTNEESATSHRPPLPAPKVRLPTHSESYNPPKEYLPTDEEKKEWEEMDPEDRPENYLPRSHDTLRHVPAYEDFVKERFDRQLDLYLAPRVRRVKLNIDPESLVPKLPSPKELRPFPTAQNVVFEHEGKARVRCVSWSMDGEWVATGDERGTVRCWEAEVGKCVWQGSFGSEPVGAVEWCPKYNFFLIAVSGAVHLVIPPFLPPAQRAAGHTYTTTAFSTPSAPDPDAPKWTSAKTPLADGHVLSISLTGNPKQLAWHGKGDYFASVAPDAAAKAVWIHQITKHHSQSPFRKVKGTVQLVSFHPKQPHFFVATQKYVRHYDLVGQKLLRTLTPGLRWISSLSVHPSGEHLIVGSYDKKLAWFDLEMGIRPFRVLRYHSRALRSVAFSPAHPLFASASDDGTVQVFHATVFADLMTDPRIVPVKVLRGHAVTDGLGVLGVRWHPRLSWCVSVGADGRAVLWCN